MKRTSLLIHRPFQLAVIAYANAIAAAVLIVLYRAGAYFFQTLERQPQIAALAEGDPLRFFLQQQQHSLLALICGLAVFLCVLVTVGALILSHRVAGPLYRLRHHFDRIAAGGEPGEVRFRQRDLFPELAKSANGALARLRRAPVEKEKCSS